MKMMCALNMWWWLDDWTDDDEGCKSFTDYMEGIIKPLVYDWMVEEYGANPELKDQLVALVQEYRANNG